MVGQAFEVVIPPDLHWSVVSIPKIAQDSVSAKLPELGQRFRRAFLRQQFKLGAGRVVPGKVTSRSALLRRSFGVTQQPDGSLSLWSAGALYARIQEHGGEIKPKKGKFLTIPLRGAKTANGVTRQAAKLVKKGSEWHTAGKVPGASDTKTFIRRNKRGTPMIFVQAGEKRLIPLYVLRRKTKLPPRLGYFKAWNDFEPERTKWYERQLRHVGIVWESVTPGAPFGAGVRSSGGSTVG